ncbi:hypothetical protein [Pseudooceanicola sp. MF1-13]|uniref:hypothetical protein n=1 Tax=Pseudooceanicola sp. MF1-13 TaxID=3379095 RepID=UPI00389195DC
MAVLRVRCACDGNARDCEDVVLVGSDWARGADMISVLDLRKEIDQGVATPVTGPRITAQDQKEPT